MPWLTPSTLPENKRCRVFQIPDDSDFLAAFYGAILPLTYERNWEVPPNGGITAGEAALAFQQMYDLSRQEGSECVPDTCDCIKNLSYNSGTGELTYIDGNGDTQTIFNSQDLSLTYNAYSNLIPPPVEDTDKYCYAAHSLYRDWADSLGDILEVVIANNNVTIAGIKWLISFPTLGLTPAEETVEFIGAILQSALTYANQNIADEDAQELGAKVLYCAMLEAGAANDLENLWDYVDWRDALPEFAFEVNAWENFGEWAQWLYDNSDGQLMAWYVLAYARFGLFNWGEVLGMVEPIEKEIAAYANRAENFDARDCSEFECNQNCIVFDFSLGDLGWEDYANAGRGHYNGTDAWESDTVSGVTRTDIKSPTFATPIDVTKIEVLLDVEFGSDQNRYFALYNQAGTEISNDDITMLGEGEGIISMSEIAAIGVYSIRIDFQTGTGFGNAGFSKVYKVKVFIDGAIPEWAEPC